MLGTKFPSKKPVQSNLEQSVKANFLFCNMLLSFLVAIIMLFYFFNMTQPTTMSKHFNVSLERRMLVWILFRDVTAF